MTAPASPLDLDTLEARLLDAERADLLVEHGVRFTDIKWLIAAARERDRWYKAAHDGIDNVAEALSRTEQELAAVRQRAEQAEAERDALRAVLVDVRAVVAELVAVDRRRLSRVVADIDAALAPEHSVDVRCPCCNDTGRCTYADGSSHACPTCAPEQPGMASDDVRALAELHRIRVWLTADQMDLLRYARQDEAWFTQFIEDPAAAHERMWEALRKRREAAQPAPPDPPREDEA